MIRYHVNPETGEKGVCSVPPERCRFRTFENEADADHFSQQVMKDLYGTVHSERRNSSRSSEKDLRAASEKVSENIQIENGTMRVIEDLRRNGGVSYVVGGAVRDALADGVSSKDIDLEVHGMDLDTIVSTLRASGCHVNEVGRQFGVLKVRRQGSTDKDGVTDLDVAVPRRENRIGARHGDFSVETDTHMSVEEAVNRRDFTVNAVMYDPVTREVLDPSGGVEDMRNHVLRAVSDKFSEDPLRVMRGFQLAGRLGLHYDSGTADTARQLRSQYDSIPEDRVREEWSKFFVRSTSPADGIRALRESGWDDTLPGLRTALERPEVLEGLSGLPHIDKDRRNVLGAAVILSAVDKDDRDRTGRILTPTMKDSRRAISLAEEDGKTADDCEQVRWIAFDRSRSGFRWHDCRTLGELMGDQRRINAGITARNLDVEYGPQPLFIDGDDIVHKFPNRKPGPWISHMLNEVRGEQYAGHFETPDDALRYITRGGPFRNSDRDRKDDDQS